MDLAQVKPVLALKSLQFKSQKQIRFIYLNLLYYYIESTPSVHGTVSSDETVHTPELLVV